MQFRIREFFVPKDEFPSFLVINFGFQESPRLLLDLFRNFANKLHFLRTFDEFGTVRNCFLPLVPNAVVQGIEVPDQFQSFFRHNAVD